MRIPTAIIIFAAAAAASTGAFAQTTRLSDVEYIKASRCAGLMGAEALGGGDVASFDALLKAQRRARESFILERAANARKDAMRAAAKAENGAKAGLIAERDGICKTFLG